MKRVFSLLFSLLLCCGILLMPVSAEEEIPDPATQVAEETPAPAEDATEPAPVEPTAQEPADPETPAEDSFSPYSYPTHIDFFDDHDWRVSLMGRYYAWTRDLDGERSDYDRAFRQYYADDPLLTIVDHVVYEKFSREVRKNGKKTTEYYYLIIDYFDTDEAEQATTTLRIRSEIDDIPVAGCYVYGKTYFSAGLYYAGYSNNTVKSIVVDEGVTALGAYAFARFTALKKVTLPSTLNAISVYAFYHCSNLKKVIGGENLTRVGSCAFSGCEKLRSFPQMQTLESIEGDAFAGCGFRTLTLSADTYFIGGDEDHYEIGSNFANCKDLKTVTFTDAKADHWLWIAEGMFSGCTALETVTLPKVCKEITIEYRAFSGCTALTGVENVSKITEIQSVAFQNCTVLKTFVLPLGLKYACSDAFSGCKNLKKLYINGKNPTLFDQRTDPYFGSEIDNNFVKTLPKTCTVFVKTKDMKYAVRSHGFKGTVKIRVKVAAPKVLKATKKDGKVTFKWSKVTKADGYRVYSYNAKTKTYTKLKTVYAPQRTVTLKTNAKRFAVRAFRNENNDLSWSAYTKTK